jgi:formate dehydrogenase iron-sulfur subunit
LKQEISRRTFLRGGIAAAAGLAAGSIPGAAAATAPNEETQLATLLDIGKCVGCGACVAACHETNAHKYPDPKKPFPKMYPNRVPIEDWSEKQDVADRLTPYNWLFIQHAIVNVNGEEQEITLPRRCMHCVNPPCVKLCPLGHSAINRILFYPSQLCHGDFACQQELPDF